MLELTQIEYDYLIKADYIDKQIKPFFPAHLLGNGIIKIAIDDETLLNLYEQLEDKLVSSGFDENYNITKEGSIIESIMDKITDQD